MENEALAKSNNKKTIKEHTRDLLYQLHIFKFIYPNILSKDIWGLLKRAVVYHDLGKINSKFQNKLYKKLGYKEFLIELDDEEEVPHNFLSPLFIDSKKYMKKYGLTNTMILFSSVYYHHDRKFRKISENDIKDLKEQAKYLGILPSKVKKYSDKYVLFPDNRTNLSILEGKDYIQVKGLLNRLDHIASLDNPNVNIEEDLRDEGQTVGDRIQEKFKGNYREVQEYMLENKNENLVVISPTGSGKTEAALLWLGDTKAFYTLPLKVSINAMENRITNDIKYSKALLLHSDAYAYYEQEENKKDAELNKYERAKKMSAPLIITTIDQLFKIVFKYNGYEEILATLSYSKLVIDEIQMYSSELVGYILLGLMMITKVGGKFAIITATFPDFLYNEMERLGIPFKRRDGSFESHIKNRHKIKLLEDREFDFECIKEKSKTKKVLIIVNTVKRAQAIYEKLKEEPNVHLLHSHYIKKDRKILEDEILQFGNREENDDNGIWISTQIVEASLDIDFDVLFTELCSIDSLFQRMGRVYRKREYSGREANVYILNNKNGVPYIIDEEIYDYTLKTLQNFKREELSEEDKQNMIHAIFSFEKNEKLMDSRYYNKIKSTIDNLKDIRPYKMPSKEIINKFRNIQNVSLIPDNIYDELNNNGTIDRWRDVLKSNNSKVSDKMKIKEEIRNHVVNVRWHPNLDMQGEELFYSGSNIYRTSYVYEFDKENKTGLGLIMSNMYNIGYFDE